MTQPELETLNVLAISVSPEWRRIGLATALIDEVLNQCSWAIRLVWEMYEADGWDFLASLHRTGRLSEPTRDWFKSCLTAIILRPVLTPEKQWRLAFKDDLPWASISATEGPRQGARTAPDLTLGADDFKMLLPLFDFSNFKLRIKANNPMRFEFEVSPVPWVSDIRTLHFELTMTSTSFVYTVLVQPGRNNFERGKEFWSRVSRWFQGWPWPVRAGITVMPISEESAEFWKSMGWEPDPRSPAWLRFPLSAS